MTIYYIAAWTATGLITGTGRTQEAALVPSGAIVCTQAQAESPSLYAVVDGVVVQSLAGYQSAQSILLRQSYASANAADISFTDSAGVTDTYQCGPASILNLQNCLSAFRAAAAVPSGFYWRSSTNNNNPFSYADLVGLATAAANRGFTNFAQLQTLLAEIQAATTVADVQAVVWP